MLILYFREEILTENLSDRARSMYERDIVLVARLLEQYMYYTAPSLDRYQSSSSLRFITNIFCIQLAAYIYREEMPDLLALRRIYDRVI